MAVTKRKSLAQVGAGDPKVVAHPGYREIPACLFPLTSDEAKAEYDRLARVLFDAGRMTLGKHSALSAYAMQFDTMQTIARSGKVVKGLHFEQLARALKTLDLDATDSPIAAPSTAAVNRYARFGVSRRR